MPFFPKRTARPPSPPHRPALRQQLARPQPWALASPECLPGSEARSSPPRPEVSGVGGGGGVLIRESGEEICRGSCK